MTVQLLLYLLGGKCQISSQILVWGGQIRANMVSGSLFSHISIYYPLLYTLLSVLTEHLVAFSLDNCASNAFCQSGFYKREYFPNIMSNVANSSKMMKPFSEKSERWYQVVIMCFSPSSTHQSCQLEGSSVKSVPGRTETRNKLVAEKWQIEAGSAYRNINILWLQIY